VHAHRADSPLSGPDPPALDDPIGQKYDALGGSARFGPVLHVDPDRSWSCAEGFLCRDSTAPDGVFEIRGKIHARWQELGGPTCYLGLPVSDEAEFDGGRANSFAGGGIYWWPDLGAIDLRGVSISYTGVRRVELIGQDVDNDSGAYILITEATPLTVGTRRTQVYSGLSEGRSRPDLLEIYRGPPYGMNVHVVVMDRDLKDPNACREVIESIVRTEHADRMSSLPVSSTAGPALADPAAPILTALIPAWAAAVDRLIAPAEGHPGSRGLWLSPRDLVVLAAAGRTEHIDGIRYTFRTGCRGRSGATYHVHFEVVPI